MPELALQRRGNILEQVFKHKAPALLTRLIDRDLLEMSDQLMCLAQSLEDDHHAFPRVSEECIDHGTAQLAGSDRGIELFHLLEQGACDRYGCSDRRIQFMRDTGNQTAQTGHAFVPGHLLLGEAIGGLGFPALAHRL